MTLAEQYVELRAEKLNKPAAWVKGMPEIEADDIDMYYLRGAHYTRNGRVIVFADGSLAVKTIGGRRTPWQVVPGTEYLV